MKAGPRGWAVVSLHEYAEGLTVAELGQDLRRHLPGGTFLFPAVVRGKLDEGNPLAAYVFLMANRTDRRLLAVERSRYVDKLLCLPHTRQISRLTDDDLQRMVQPSGPAFTPGDRVVITVGDWSGLEARVVAVLKAGVRVRVDLWSRQEEFLISPKELKPA